MCGRQQRGTAGGSARHSRAATAPCHRHAATPSSFSQGFSCVTGMLLRPVLTLLVVAAAATHARPSTRRGHHPHRHNAKEDAAEEALDMPHLRTSHHSNSFYDSLTLASRSSAGQLFTLALVVVVVVVIVVVLLCRRCKATDLSSHGEGSPVTERGNSSTQPSPLSPLLFSPFSSPSSSVREEEEEEEEEEVVPICTYLTPRSPDDPHSGPLHSLRDPFDMSALSRSPRP